MFELSLVNLFITLLILSCTLFALIILITASSAVGSSSDAMDVAFREHLLQRYRLNKLKQEADLSLKQHRALAPLHQNICATGQNTNLSSMEKRIQSMGKEPVHL